MAIDIYQISVVYLTDDKLYKYKHGLGKVNKSASQICFSLRALPMGRPARGEGAFLAWLPRGPGVRRLKYKLSETPHINNKLSRRMTLQQYCPQRIGLDLSARTRGSYRETILRRSSLPCGIEGSVPPCSSFVVWRIQQRAGISRVVRGFHPAEQARFPLYLAVEGPARPRAYRRRK